MSGPRPIVAMGVSGSGKSTFGKALAERLGAPFLEGDDMHPPENVAKMHAGQPLSDADRAPWLERVAAALAAQSGWAVVSCSALKRGYRDRLRADAPAAAFVLLHADEDVLRDRVAHRKGHFMPPSLLESQLATLEPPAADEHALTLDATRDVDRNVADACAWLARS